MEWKVPLSDIDLGTEEFKAIDQVLHSKWLSMGSVTQAFEQAFAEHLGVKYAFAVANGTVALHLAYAALDLTAADEVIVPALTFVATANAVLYTGARPVFADIIGPEDLTLDPQSIEAHITPQTRAICVMHYAGYPCAMDQIMDIARRHHLAVIEDAAHAPGAAFLNQKCGAFGDVSCFSFFSNKNLAMGEGGMVVTNRDDLAEKIRLMRSHGMTTLTWDRHRGHAHSYDVVALGYNYRLDEIRSALGLEQLKKLTVNNHHRAELTATYREKLSKVPGLSLPFSTPRGTPSYHIFPILLDPEIDRRNFIESLKAQGIQTSIHYPPIHTFTFYRQTFGNQDGLLPRTEDVGRREVTLPLYPLMNAETQMLVIQAVKETLQTA